MEHIILMKACFWWHVWVRRVALFSRGNVCKPKQAVLCTSPKLGQKMLANESKSSSAVQSATRFLRHELRKICTSHKKKKGRRRCAFHTEGVFWGYRGDAVCVPRLSLAASAALPWQFVSGRESCLPCCHENCNFCWVLLSPRLHQRSVINMHCGSPSRSCTAYNEAVVGLVIIVETTVQWKHSHAASCLIERWQICSQNTSATCIVWQMCFSFPLHLFPSLAFFFFSFLDEKSPISVTFECCSSTIDSFWNNPQTRLPRVYHFHSKSSYLLHPSGSLGWPFGSCSTFRAGCIPCFSILWLFCVCAGAGTIAGRSRAAGRPRHLSAKRPAPGVAPASRMLMGPWANLKASGAFCTLPCSAGSPQISGAASSSGIHPHAWDWLRFT